MPTKLLCKKEFCVRLDGSIEKCFCYSIKFETNFFSSVKLEPCDEFLILTFSSRLLTECNYVSALNAFQFKITKIKDARESINHKDTRQWLGGVFCLCMFNYYYSGRFVGKISSNWKKIFRGEILKRTVSSFSRWQQSIACLLYNHFSAQAVNFTRSLLSPIERWNLEV